MQRQINQSNAVHRNLGHFDGYKDRRRPASGKYLLKSIGFGGEAGIRTLDALTSMPHFECGAFDHSATSPRSDGAPQERPGRERAVSAWSDACQAEKRLQVVSRAAHLARHCLFAARGTPIYRAWNTGITFQHSPVAKSLHRLSRWRNFQSVRSCGTNCSIFVG